MIPVVQRQSFVSPCPKNCGEMMLVTGAQASVQPIARIGSNIVQPYRILVTVVQQNQYVSQRLKTLMEYSAQLHLLHMAVLFHAKLWMD